MSDKALLKDFEAGDVVMAYFEKEKNFQPAEVLPYPSKDTPCEGWCSKRAISSTKCKANYDPCTDCRSML